MLRFLIYKQLLRPLKNRLLIQPFVFCVFMCLIACNRNKHMDKSTFFFQKIDNEIITDSNFEIPKPLGWTNDYADLFTDEEIVYLDSLSANYEKKTSVEIAIVTIPSFLVSEADFEPYTLSILNEWGIGKAEKNNGILIAIAPKYGRLRIQNGFGIKKFLSNEETKKIIDSVFVPHFSEEGYFEGTKQGIEAIVAILTKHGIK